MSHAREIPDSAIQSPEGATYRPQLDGVRAAAIGFVLLSHFGPSYSRWLPGGNIGVRIFFVLSGFLITGILLRLNAVAHQGSGPKFLLRQFFVRRVLRIFPVYFLVLFIALICGEVMTGVLPWLATFTGNWYMVLHNKSMGAMSPFWTVAVEEQFYLLWPWVVLFIPARHLLVVLLAMVLSGFGIRIIGAFADVPFLFLYCSTFTAMDALGLGGLLAYSFHFHDAPLMRKWLLVGGKIGLAASALCYAAKMAWPTQSLVFHFSEIAAALAALWLIAGAYSGFSGALGAVLSWQPVVFIGKISYGIYAYHMVIYSVLASTLLALGLDPNNMKTERFVCQIILSILVPAISWRYMEKPINSLKRHFPYGR